jgi:hypothetical protein
MYIQVHEKITKHVTKLVGLRPPHGSYSGHPAEVDRFSKIIHVGERKCERRNIARPGGVATHTPTSSGPHCAAHFLSTLLCVTVERIGVVQPESL